MTDALTHSRQLQVDDPFTQVDSGCLVALDLGAGDARRNDLGSGPVFLPQGIKQSMEPCERSGPDGSHERLGETVEAQIICAI